MNKARRRRLNSELESRLSGWQSHAGIVLLLILTVCFTKGCGRNKKADSSDPSTTNDPTSVASPSRKPSNPKPRLPDVAQPDGSEEVVSMDTDSLVEALGHQDLQKRYDAAERLLEDPDRSLPVLIEALSAENYHVRAGAAFALGKLGARAKDALSELEKARDKDSRNVVRDAAAFAIDAINESE